MAVAYQTANEWQEPQCMNAAFDALSWEDPYVLAALPRYLRASPIQRLRVDHAYHALFPTPPHPHDAKRGMMQLWIKARLFSYDEKAPFQFNPYSRKR